MRPKIAILAALLTLTLAPALTAGGFGAYDQTMAKAWEATYNTGDAAAVAAYYTEDGIRMPPNQPLVTGREAIAAQVKQGMEMGIAQVRLETEEIMTSGDIGFARGTYVIIDPEGNEIDNGKWMQVGKKMGDTWYAYRDIWNSDNPLPE
jgi:ketosteroid isomerase-like protein